MSPKQHPKKPTPPPSSGLLIKNVEHTHHRMLKTVCVTGMIGTVLLLAIFFMSDIPTRMLEAKTKTTTQAPESSFSESNDMAAAVVGPTYYSSQEQVSEGTSTKTIESEQVNWQEKLSSMDEQELGNLVEAVESTVLSSSEQSSETASDKAGVLLYGELEDAYAKAEEKYPGQIDASARLKRIQDIHATSYRYYVTEEGDTLIQLSRTFDTPLGQLIELNGIHDADVIPAGMILLFPLDTEQPNITETR